MTEQKAKEVLNNIWNFADAQDEEKGDVVDDAIIEVIGCMEEVEQYRALGTVEELKEALEKQIPKKCEIYTALQIGIDKDYEVDVYECPKCGTHLGVADEINQSPYCWNCGKALKWGEEDE